MHLAFLGGDGNALANAYETAAIAAVVVIVLIYSAATARGRAKGAATAA